MAQDVDLAQLARDAGRAIGEGDLEGFLAQVHPEVEFTSMIAEIDGETFRGHDGVRRWWSAVRETFEEGIWEYDHIQVAGERGVARLRIRGRMSGVPVEQTMWQAFRARQGLAAWWAFFRSEAEARAVVGMDE